MASGRVSPKRGKVMDIPNPPTIGTATAGVLSASVAFTADSSGKGGPTFSYTALSNPGSVTGSGTSSPVTVSGLTSGTASTFTVRGNNATGSSEYTSASNSVTPTASPAYESIATITGESGQTFTITNIPQTFTHLQLRAISRVSLGSYTFSGYSMRVGNGSVDTGSNYSNHRIYTTGNGSIGADGSSNASSIDGPFFTANNAIANNVAVTILDILDYKNTNKYKTIRMLTAFDNNDTGSSSPGAGSIAFIQYGSAAWRSTSAINTMSFSMGGSATNSVQQFALYGIKGA